MADDSERYVARLEFRGDSNYWDAEQIADELQAIGYRTEHSVTTGALEVYDDE